MTKENWGYKGAMASDEREHYRERRMLEPLVRGRRPGRGDPLEHRWIYTLRLAPKGSSTGATARVMEIGSPYRHPLMWRHGIGPYAWRRQPGPFALPGKAA